MPPRTKIFKQLPWIGGLNTSLDPGQIPNNQLVIADHLLFGVRGSRKQRDGISYNWDTGSNGAASIIGLKDFWFGATTRTQRMVGIDDSKNIYSYNGGTRTTLTLDSSVTAWSSAISSAAFESLNNLCLMFVDGSGNFPRKWDGTNNVFDLGYYTATGNTANTSNQITNLSTTVGVYLGAVVTGTGIPASTTVIAVNGSTATISNAATATNTGVTLTFRNSVPQASIARQHLGRLWTNDKTNPDRIHYSETGNPELFLGNGDSGALDIGPGDGDPTGITAIFPTFHGTLFVAKQTKLYRIDGYTPETFSIRLVSNGVGCISHNSIATVDQTDIVFASERGFHSLQATVAAGDFDSSFLSYDIQKTFNEKFPKSRLKYIWGAYLDNINSVAFAVTDSQVGSVSNNTVYLYNLPLKSWYRWPSVSCQSMIVSNDADKKRFYFGGSNTRVAKSFTGNNYDLDTSGAQQAILFKVQTGILFPQAEPYLITGYKKLIVYFSAQGTFTLTASIKIDNYPTQATVFSQTGTSLLGVNFILGQSLLGGSSTLLAYANPIDGYGRGIQVTFTQSNPNQTVELQGFGLEIESAGTQQESVV